MLESSKIATKFENGTGFATIKYINWSNIYATDAHTDTPITLPVHMCMGSYLTRWAKAWHIQQNYYWIWVCWTGCFPAELRLVHQRVTWWLHSTYHEARLCLNSQAGQWNMGMHYLDNLVHVFQKMRFHPAPSLYTVVFLSINTLFHFHDRCLSQLSFPTVFANFQTAFLQEHVNF